MERENVLSLKNEFLVGNLFFPRGAGENEFIFCDSRSLRAVVLLKRMRSHSHIEHGAGRLLLRYGKYLSLSVCATIWRSHRGVAPSRRRSCSSITTVFIRAP